MKYQICFSASEEVRRYLRQRSKKSGYSVSSIINAIILEHIQSEKEKAAN